MATAFQQLTAKQRAALDEQITAWLGVWLTADPTHVPTHATRLFLRSELTDYCIKAKIDHRDVWQQLVKPALQDLAAHLGVEGWYTDTFGFYHHG